MKQWIVVYEGIHIFVLAIAWIWINMRRLLKAKSLLS